MKFSSIVFTLLPLLLNSNRFGICKDVVETIQQMNQLSQFSKYIDEVSWAKNYLSSEEITLFAPTNKAFEKYLAINKNISIGASDIFTRHIVSRVINIQEFPGKFSTMMNYPDLWLGLVNSTGTNKLEYIVQNALILNMDNQTELKTNSTPSKPQKLYIIDKVLQIISWKEFTAWDLMERPNDYGISEIIAGFTKRVIRYSAENLFDSRNKLSTFFIPVGNTSQKDFNKIDRMLIGGHVIPDKVLFTRQLQKGLFSSEMHDRDVKVDLSFNDVATSRSMIKASPEIVVKSHTEISNIFARSSNGPKHGTVLSKILPSLSNIPVSNGVVHFIETPLVVSTTVLQNIENYNQVSGKFLEIMTKSDRFGQLLSGGLKTLTLFLPTNEAFEKIPKKILDEILKDEFQLEEMLYMHIVPVALHLEELQAIRIAKSLAPGEYLYFDVNRNNGVPDLTVEGGGSNATAVETDITAVNGVVHVINQVLGVPLQNIFDKLKADPKLRTTFQLGEINSWNDQFNTSQDVFTFFSPSENTWNNFKTEHPVIYHSLFANEQPKEIIDKILQRYTFKGKVLFYEDVLVKLANGSIHIGSDNFYRNKKRQIQFERYNLKATNGIIHIIDDVRLLPFTTLHGILCHTKYLSTSYGFGEKLKWNEKFKRTDKNFTYFVPSNTAWTVYENGYPEEFQNLHSGHYREGTLNKILGRLVVEGSFTKDDLLAKFRLKTSNGETLRIHKYPHEKRVWLELSNIRVEITEYDLTTTNGVIHIINKAVISMDDVIIPSCASCTVPLTILFAVAVSCLLFG